MTIEEKLELALRHLAFGTIVDSMPDKKQYEWDAIDDVRNQFFTDEEWHAIWYLNQYEKIFDAIQDAYDATIQRHQPRTRKMQREDLGIR